MLYALVEKSYKIMIRFLPDSCQFHARILTELVSFSNIPYMILERILQDLELILYESCVNHASFMQES